MNIDDVLQPDGSVWIADQVFPARVIDYRVPHLPRNGAKTCLLQVDNSRWALMVVGNTGTGPGILSLDEVVLLETTSITRRAMVVESTTEIHWASDPADCGCGSRIRGWTPFTGRLLGVPLPQV